MREDIGEGNSKTQRKEKSGKPTKEILLLRYAAVELKLVFKKGRGKKSSGRTKIYFTLHKPIDRGWEGWRWGEGAAPL